MEESKELHLTIKQLESIKSLYNIVIGFVPGKHVINEIIEYRSNIQKERLRRFSELLRQGFEETTGKSFDLENLKTEEFIDAFELVIRKVAQTKSKEKVLRYRNVLLKAIYEKDESEMFLKYFALIDEISETQMLILSTFSIGFNSGVTETNIMQNLINPEKIHDYLINRLNIKDITLASGQKLNDKELKFYLFDLKSKGLIELSIEKDDESQYEREKYYLTIIGRGFLDFVREYK
jgi:hypothetical protein